MQMSFYCHSNKLMWVHTFRCQILYAYNCMLVGLFGSNATCARVVELDLAVPFVGMRYVFIVFSTHTHTLRNGST